MPTLDQEPKKEWIVQRSKETWDHTSPIPTLQYEDWPGYCEKLMTHNEMTIALKECEAKFPYEFRGHRVLHDNKILDKQWVEKHSVQQL